MFGISRMAKTIALAVGVCLLGLAPMSSAQAQDATIQFEVYKAGFIVGASGGGGTLYYKGKGYRFDVGGISLGATIGASRAELIGQVYNLSKPEDIAGTYTAVGGSAVLAGGVSVVELKNANGVRLSLQGRSIGLELSVDLSGLQIVMR